MLTRVLTAVAAIPVFIGVCLWGLLPFTVMVTLLAAIALLEMLARLPWTGHQA
jgi:predicted TIM-barrel enzyme